MIRTRLQGDTPFFPNMLNNWKVEVSLKEDVDKVIEERDKTIEGLQADYKEACDRLQTTNLIKDEQLAATRHHKYKRCLAMARWCSSCRFAWSFIPEDDEVHKSDFYKKWHKRWLELAQKFKEAK